MHNFRELEVIIAKECEFFPLEHFEIVLKEIHHIQNMIVKLKQVYGTK